MQLREFSALPDRRATLPSLIWRFGAGLFILAIPLFLITTSVQVIAGDLGFYQAGFSKYNISDRTRLPPAELTKAAQAFIHYFESDDEWLIVTVTDRSGRTFPLFNQRELLHMRDVQGLMHLVWRLQILAGLWIVAYGVVRFLRFRDSAIPDLRHLAVWGGVAALTTVAGLGGLSLLDFEAVFIQFHLLSFTNDLWLLDPDRDYLIMMFPAGFFLDATLAIAGLTVAGAIALIVLAGWVAPRFDNGRAT